MYPLQPKTKYKVVKTPATSGERIQEDRDSQGARDNLDLIQKLPKVKVNRPKKLLRSKADWARLQEVLTDAALVWPKHRSSWVRHCCCLLLPLNGCLLPTQGKSIVFTSARGEGGLTRSRMDSKMHVFSGSKSACLPKRMTLHHCIRVVRNNLNSLFQVGGVPCSLLEPFLETCTLDRLHPKEKCNSVLVEATD